ncbi:MAG: AI-2E family transporter [Chitinophagaceae bacterium]|nr:MAG: AI-2E family transporter [Chitinophagaceae bacterium]
MFGNLFRLSPRKREVKTSVSQTTSTELPFYLKASVILLGLALLFYILFLLKDILVPICFAALLGILLNPIVNKLMCWKIPKVAGILLAILLAIMVAAGIIIFISAQLASFSELAPQFQQRGTEILDGITAWVADTFNISKQVQLNKLNEAMQSGQAYIGKTLTTVMGLIGVVVLLPIYTFLILYYKPLFLNFFYDVFENKHVEKVTEVLNETKTAIQKYIQGLLIEMAIVAALNSAALLILGVKYAILIGIIGAILNLIPYIGGLVAIALPVMMSIVTGDGGYTTPLFIVGAYGLIQFIDNNIIVPRIVSSKVEVNAFFSIVIVLFGGALWGVSGMFLSIPFLAICKIIFDRIDNLKPWGHLLGTDMDEQFTLITVETEEEKITTETTLEVTEETTENSSPDADTDSKKKEEDA